MSKDQKISEKAMKFAKLNKKLIAKEYTDLNKFPTSKKPMSIFMAGSPGAGKTEFSKGIPEPPPIIRIDGDELRKCFSSYTGSNSKLFQGAISILVNEIHDLALKQKQDFILDGTLWNKDKAIINMNRSLKRNREVVIFYIYQEPKIAWEFTKKREIVENRNIPKEAFIKQFFEARKTVEYIHQHFKSEVQIYLCKKDINNNKIILFKKITSRNSIDQFILNEYTQEALEKILS